MSRKNPTPPGAPEPIEGEAPDLREALDLWREDVARTAGRVDVTGALADRIVAEAAAERGRPLAVPAGAPWYAAAAVLLIAVGVAGTLLAREAGAQSGASVVRYVDLEKALVQVLVDDAEYSPRLEGR